MERHIERQQELIEALAQRIGALNQELERKERSIEMLIKVRRSCVCWVGPWCCGRSFFEEGGGGGLISQTARLDDESKTPSTSLETDRNFYYREMYRLRAKNKVGGLQ
jgi:hypothetical protein